MTGHWEDGIFQLVPHNTRHTRRRKKPKRTQPLGITDPEALALHRELSVLRIAGGCKPGKHRDELLERRFTKLDSSRHDVPEPPLISPPDIQGAMLRLKRHFDAKAGRAA